MPEPKIRNGTLVKFRMGVRDVQGVVKEDRGPIGIKGRRLYLIEFAAEPPAPYQVELPAVEFEIVREPNFQRTSK